MKLKGILFLIGLSLLSGCRNGQPIEVNIPSFPVIYPDYKEVTMPYNIAPLNFMVEAECKTTRVSIKGHGTSTELVFKGNKVLFPQKKWEALLTENRGRKIAISISILWNDTLKKFNPFSINVSSQPVDGYLVYRLIMPGFQNWNQMGIYQRCLSNFKEETIIDSRVLPGTCMNCHSFAGNDPDNMVLHLRETYGGTILYNKGIVGKLNTKAGKMFGNAAFPYWHPSKNYIAFSVNKVNQIFHATGQFRATAIDLKSDIFIYDLVKNEMVTSTALSAEESFESFPCFSPDGLRLYYCSAKAVKIPEEFEKAIYSLCSVSFDPVTGQPGEKADTLISGIDIKKSVSIPRVSPDGNFLMFNLSDNGCFPSYNPEADLYLMDLKTGDYKALDILNSNNVESYHSWSSNGRWVVFSSRRGDGLYSNPYMSFIDENGQVAKPFILPQKDPAFYKTFLFSFNVPEFVKTRVMIDPYEIERAAKKSPAVQVVSGSGH